MLERKVILYIPIKINFSGKTINIKFYSLIHIKAQKIYLLSILVIFFNAYIYNSRNS